mgnify:CR=1 FL=1
MKPRTRLREDPLFLAAILAAPLVWLLLYFALHPPADLLWPLRNPDALFWGVIFAPLLEEILFRGLIQEFVRDYFSDKRFGLLTVANLVTSVLFVIAHIMFKGFVIWNLLVFFPSLVFGFFKDRTGRLTASVMLHAYYNLGFLWLMSG